jgi:hypothetical protein
LSFQHSIKGSVTSGIRGSPSIKCSKDIRKWKFNFQMNMEIEVTTDFTAKHGVTSKTDSNSKQVAESNSSAIQNNTVKSDCDVD